MPFQSPNQQRQSTEVTYTTTANEALKMYPINKNDAAASAALTSHG